MTETPSYVFVSKHYIQDTPILRVNYFYSFCGEYSHITERRNEKELLERKEYGKELRRMLNHFDSIIPGFGFELNDNKARYNYSMENFKDYYHDCTSNNPKIVYEEMKERIVTYCDEITQCRDSFFKE